MRRELKYTYVLRNAEVDRHWERPLDLPCSRVQLRVCPAKPDQVACDLPSLPAVHPGELVFESNAECRPGTSFTSPWDTCRLLGWPRLAG